MNKGALGTNFKIMPKSDRPFNHNSEGIQLGDVNSIFKFSQNYNLFD